MKKILITGCLIAASLMLISACKKTESTVAKRPVNLRLSEVHAQGYPTSLADEEFARLVKERTEGRVIIDVRSGGALADNEGDAIEALKVGDLAFTRVSAAPVASYVPKLNAILLPYLYRDSNHMWAVLNSSLGQGMLEDIEKSGSGLVGLCYYDGGARNFYTTKPVHSVADLAGMKIRVQGNPMMVDMCSALGAIGVTGIGVGAVRGAIESGQVDGAENNWPSYQSGGDYTVARYFTLDQHTRVPEILLASKKALSRLDPADVEIIKEVAKMTQEYEISRWKEREAQSEQIVRANGNTIITLTPSAFAEFQKAMQPLYEKYGGAYSSIIQQIQNTR
mgnify:CR=1 FL=1